VSTDGRIRNVNTGKELVLYVGNDGRKRVTLAVKDKPNQCSQFLVHRLVGIAFIENTESKKWVLHKDGDCKNNAVDNLYWGSEKDNYLDSVRHGTVGVRKPTDDEVVNVIREMKESGMKGTEIARMLDVSRSTVSKYTGKRKKGKRSQDIINMK